MRIVKNGLRDRTHRTVVSDVSSMWVPTQPGRRGWFDSGVPTVNCSNVLGTSTPRSRSPKGEPAENNRWNRPPRMKPTSPMLTRVYWLVGAGSLHQLSEIAISINKQGVTTVHHRNQGSPFACKKIQGVRRQTQHNINVFGSSLFVHSPCRFGFGRHGRAQR